MKVDLEMSTSRFFKRLAIFIAPILLCIVLVEMRLYQAGETPSYARILARQAAGEQFVYSRLFTDTNFGFKLRRAEKISPDIVTFGDSRVGQFRSGTFEPYAFYNFCNTAYFMRDYVASLQHFPSNFRPKAIIIGLGYWMFDTSNLERVRFSASDLVNTVRGRTLVYQGLFKRPDLLLKPALTPIDGLPAQGYSAITSGFGFRGDGSLRYGYRNTYRAGIFRERYRALLAEDIEKVRIGAADWAIWAPGRDIKADLGGFAAFINFWRTRGTEVIVLNLPVDAKLTQAWDHAAGFESYRKFKQWDVGPEITKLGAYYFDFSSTSSFGSSDEEMTDAIHVGEAGAIRMWLKILDNPNLRKLFEKVDPVRLNELANRPDRFDVFGDFDMPIPQQFQSQR